jgi:restriction system protein
MLSARPIHSPRASSATCTALNRAVGCGEVEGVERLHLWEARLAQTMAQGGVATLSAIEDIGRGATRVDVPPGARRTVDESAELSRPSAMALWIVRAGKTGEHESRFFGDGRIYLNWDRLQGQTLAAAKTYDEIKQIVRAAHPDDPERRLGAWSGSIWGFALGMQTGDIVVTPRKGKSAIAFGEVLGGYEYLPGGDGLYHHARKVKWIATDVARSLIDNDLLDSFGSTLTICQVKRNDAERRIRAFLASLSKSGGAPPPRTEEPDEPSSDEPVPTTEVDLERAGLDRIVRLIRERFTGHELARLVNALLQAQGYTTHLSPPGPDGGVDILAAPGTLGFGSPRLCVQVKSPRVDRPTHDQLIGVMQKVGAEQGLLVAWAGFKDSVDRERGQQFFRVRLWDADDLVEQILQHYDRLPADVRAELPLKRIWTVATVDDEE